MSKHNSARHSPGDGRQAGKRRDPPQFWPTQRWLSLNLRQAITLQVSHKHSSLPSLRYLELKAMCWKVPRAYICVVREVQTRTERKMASLWENSGACQAICLQRTHPTLHGWVSTHWQCLDSTQNIFFSPLTHKWMCNQGPSILHQEEQATVI